MESRSLVEICGTYMTKCGYCKPDKKTSVSYGLLAKRLTCADYQELIDRGWRRSGTFVYKPVMHETCCPQYTIRLDVTRFKPSKGQRHVLNRLRRYLDGGVSSSGIATPRPPPPPQNKSGSTSRKAPTLGANGGSASTAKRGPSREGGANAPRGGKDGCSNGDGDGGGGGLKGIGVLSERVAAAAVAAVEGGSVPGLGSEGEWLAEVVVGSQVRPIRNKRCRASGRGGFCSAVALSIASAARRRGWGGTGGAGGAVAVAEAIAESMRGGRTGSGEGPDFSEISVAPNGFINFEADFGSPLVSSTATQHRPPVSPPGAVGAAPTAAETPTPPAAPPSVPALPPTPGTREVMPPHYNSASGGDAYGSRARPKESLPRAGTGGVSGRDLLAQGNGGSSSSKCGKGDEGMYSGRGSKGIDASGASLEPPGTGASVADGSRVGRGGMAGHGDGDLTVAAAAARMEWVERHGNNAGGMEVEASSVPSDATAPVAAGSGSSTGLSSLPPLDPGLAPHRMTVSTVPARVTDEVFRLYLKYQVSVHGDLPAEVTRTQFRRFLVDSPLIRETVDGTVIRPRRKSSYRGRDGRPTFPAGEGAGEGVAGEEDAEVTEGRDSLSVPYGSYHQLYRIGGRLVAVGVVDVLPKCLSSVYCFYDPDFRALALGKLTALKETEFVREARAVRPALQDYYMGFYIHTCPKMSYKGSYTPSFLLCPERLSWVPLELCRPVLDKYKYARLSDLVDPILLPPSLSDVLSETGTQTGSGSGSDSSGLNGGAGAGGGQRNGRPTVQSPAESSNSNSSSSSSKKKSQADGWEDWGVAPATAGQKSSGCSSSPSCLSKGKRVPGQCRSSKAPGSCSARPGSSSGFTAGLNGGSGRGGGGDGVGGGGGGGGDSEGIERREMAAATAAARQAAAARAADEASGIYEIPLMVGHPSFPVSLSALMPQSQVIARDVLRTYIATIGSDLAKRVILKLSN